MLAEMKRHRFGQVAHFRAYRACKEREITDTENMGNLSTVPD